MYHYAHRQFAATDDIFCLFDGHLENLARLRASYGITQHKITEAAFVIEMYKALRDRAPVTAEQALQSFHGPFSFILYDQRNKKVFIAQDMFGKRPLFWGRLKNGNLCVGDDKQMLRAMCSHAVAPYPNGEPSCVNVILAWHCYLYCIASYLRSSIPWHTLHLFLLPGTLSNVLNSCCASFACCR